MEENQEKAEDYFISLWDKGNSQDKYKVAFKFKEGKEIVIGQMNGEGEFILYLKPAPGSIIEFNDGDNTFTLYLEKIG